VNVERRKRRMRKEYKGKERVSKERGRGVGG
jgi:hypothetical protein